jgi:hypothetical protein
MLAAWHQVVQAWSARQVRLWAEVVLGLASVDAQRFEDRSWAGWFLTLADERQIDELELPAHMAQVVLSAVSVGDFDWPP